MLGYSCWVELVGHISAWKCCYFPTAQVSIMYFDFFLFCCFWAWYAGANYLGVLNLESEPLDVRCQHISLSLRVLPTLHAFLGVRCIQGNSSISAVFSVIHHYIPTHCKYRTVNYFLKWPFSLTPFAQNPFNPSVLSTFQLVSMKKATFQSDSNCFSGGWNLTQFKFWLNPWSEVQIGHLISYPSSGPLSCCHFK
jgi:hypothetical protein